ncbi:MAG: methyltransferase [Scytonema sp. RU_4_4]|nr:methyltransferase [Scytonema sp. RU_4_4]
MFTTEAINQTNQMNLSEILLHMSNGTFVAQTIYVAAKLGIADLLKDGAKSSDELAKLTDVDAQALYRVLRALSSIGIFAEGENRRFELTPLAKCLQSDIPGSMRPFAISLGEPLLWQICGNLLDSVKTGKNAFENIFGDKPFGGKPFGDKPFGGKPFGGKPFGGNPFGGKPFGKKPLPFMMAQNPEEIMQTLSEAVNALTSSIIPVMLTSYDFSPFSKIVDVGGGYGALITEILKMNPTMKGILFDQPPVAQGARHFIETKGIAERCEIVAGNFLESVPSGGDAYVLKHVLHTSDNENALTILKNCHKAMAENGKLIVFEAVISPANKPSLSKWLDLHMLLMGNGCERTETEYRELLAAAGFMVNKVVFTQASIDVIEAVKV